jgi:copper chaperone CopZ
VIPAGLGLRKDGASRGATVGFLISTPQTGVDSVLVSASFLGWPFAIFKVLAAGVTGLFGGWLSDRLDDEAEGRGAEQAIVERSGAGPREMLDHALEIVRTIWRWLVIGIAVSALIAVWIPPGRFESLAQHGRILPMLLALVVSLPLYVCATASVPIAAALVAGGFPPGAALVFLMAGPATNLATIGAIRRSLGGRTLLAYLLAIIGGSMGLGLAFDFLLDVAPAMTTHSSHGPPSWWKIGSAIVLLLLLTWFAWEDLRRWMGGRRSAADPAGPVVEMGVAGMTCESCVNKLETALRSEPGVTGVRVALDLGQATVYGEIDTERLMLAIENAGFKPEP